MPKKLLFKFNKEVEQNYTYIKYTGTDITVTNTLEKPIKNAILIGNTLILDELGNKCEAPDIPSVTMGAYIDVTNGTETKSATSFITTFLKYPTGSFVVKGDNKYKKIGFYDENKTFLKGVDAGVNNNRPIEIPYSNIPSNAVYMRMSASVNPAGVTYTPNTKLLIEDRSGNNLYITHSESPEIPVLTNTNADATKSNILTVNEDVTLRSNGSVYDELDLLTGKLTQRIDENGGVLSQEIVKTVDLSILDQNENKVSSISSFNDTTHITASSGTIPPIFEGYLATKEVE